MENNSVEVCPVARQGAPQGRYGQMDHPNATSWRRFNNKGPVVERTPPGNLASHQDLGGSFSSSSSHPQQHNNNQYHQNLHQQPLQQPGQSRHQGQSLYNAHSRAFDVESLSSNTSVTMSPSHNQGPPAGQLNAHIHPQQYNNSNHHNNHYNESGPARGGKQGPQGQQHSYRPGYGGGQGQGPLRHFPRGGGGGHHPPGSAASLNSQHRSSGSSNDLRSDAGGPHNGPRLHNTHHQSRNMAHEDHAHHTRNSGGGNNYYYPAGPSGNRHGGGDGAWNNNNNHNNPNFFTNRPQSRDGGMAHGPQQHGSQHGGHNAAYGPKMFFNPVVVSEWLNERCSTAIMSKSVASPDSIRFIDLSQTAGPPPNVMFVRNQFLQMLCSSFMGARSFAAAQFPPAVYTPGGDSRPFSAGAALMDPGNPNAALVPPLPHPMQASFFGGRPGEAMYAHQIHPQAVGSTLHAGGQVPFLYSQTPIQQPENVTPQQQAHLLQSAVPTAPGGHAQLPPHHQQQQHTGRTVYNDNVPTPANNFSMKNIGSQRKSSGPQGRQTLRSSGGGAPTPTTTAGSSDHVPRSGPPNAVSSVTASTS